MKWLFLNIIGILSIFPKFITTQTCSVGLDCITTFCCKSNQCSPIENCKNETKIVYIAVGAAGLVILIMTIIYYFISRSRTRKMMDMYSCNLENMDDGVNAPNAEPHGKGI